MGLSEIELFRLEKAVLHFCQTRNQNTPAELGKTQFEINPEGVFISKQCFLLDSSHIDSICPVAKLVLNSETRRWKLFAAELDNAQELIGWYEYPYLKESRNYEEQLNELLHDPQNVFW